MALLEEVYHGVGMKSFEVSKPTLFLGSSPLLSMHLVPVGQDASSSILLPCSTPR